ncbi:hypothetical protein SKDZ_03G0010 [Saccharomyces kudriavzevii ZP591]|nr:hypothetical protein SKDZ_03G0010 [Saccharomyces kudriavzevii ZP591]
MTGIDAYCTLKQQDEERLDMLQFFLEAVLRPFRIIARENIVACFDAYMALLYGSLYLFFESFPLVFVDIYGFSLVEMGVAYMGFTVGCIFGYLALYIFQTKVIDPKFDSGTFEPESLLPLNMAVGWIFPSSLFLFGLAASVHWMLVEFSLFLFMFAVFIIFQISFSYLAICYPCYVASVFAGSALTRSLFACAFPLFGTVMYNNLAIEHYPVAWVPP